MVGTKEGGIKARDTNLAKYGQDFYKVQGAKGGSKTGVKKGFAANPDLARKAGSKGGKNRYGWRKYQPVDHYRCNNTNHVSTRKGDE